MSPRHDASLGYEYRRRPPNVKGSCEYIKRSRTTERGIPPDWELGEGLTTLHIKKIRMLRTVTQCVGIGRIFWNDKGNGTCI